MFEVLVLGTLQDPHVERVVTRLRKRGVDCELFDANANTRVCLRQSREGGIDISVNGRNVDDQCLIWNRLKLSVGSPYYFPIPRNAAEHASEYEKIVKHERELGLRVAEWQRLAQLIALLHARQTVNNPHTSRVMHKVLQQVVANDVGLATPPTLVTTDKDAALDFVNGDGRFVIKSSGVLIRAAEGALPTYHGLFTNPVTREDVALADREQLGGCPTMFQWEIAKAYELRVVVVGESIVAFRINSQDKEYGKVDWRAATSALKFERISIAPDVGESIGKFMRSFDLFTGSLDLIVDEHGTHWFLECNQDGAWGWLDNLVDGELAETFAREIERKLRTLNPSRLDLGTVDMLGKLRYDTDSYATTALSA